MLNLRTNYTAQEFLINKAINHITEFYFVFLFIRPPSLTMK